MDTKDVRRMLESLAVTAQDAADEAKEKMYTAGQTITCKYDEAKCNLALSRLKAEQEQIFLQMGRTLFLLNTGKFSGVENEKTTPKQIIDHLMIAAEQKQQELDRILERLQKISSHRYCPACGSRCEDDAKFCGECGNKLDSKKES